MKKFTLVVLCMVATLMIAGCHRHRKNKKRKTAAPPVTVVVPNPIPNPIPPPGDGTPPTVVSTIPTDHAQIWPSSYGPATGVPTNSRIAATFSEAMLASTIDGTSFTVTGPGATPVSGAVSYDAANLTAYFLPAPPFAPSTTFTATITPAVTDLSGAAMALAYAWSFTTGTTADGAAPTVHCTIPDSNETGVFINRKIEAYFSERMDSSTINAASFSVTDPGLVPVSGIVSYDVTNHVASFRPDAPFLFSTAYAATVTTAVTDLAGNPMALPFTWSFTMGTLTDILLPDVTSTLPLPGAVSVPINTRATALFSEPMDASTFNTTTFTLQLGSPFTSVLGSVVCACPGTSASFIPAADLLPGTLYTATVTTGVLDLAGNALPANFVWTFMTGPAAKAGQMPVDLGAADSFVILAAVAVSNSGPTIIDGDLGLTPGDMTGVSGFPPGSVVNGAIHVALDPLVTAAKLALDTAFLDAESRSVDVIALSGNMEGMTLAPGLYRSLSSMEITGPGTSLTLDAQGDENAVWVFQMPSSTLTTGSATSVILSGGAQAKNIFWQVGSSATLGTTSAMKGNILAQASTSLDTGATLLGRAMVRDAAVTLLSNLVTKP